MWRCNLVAFKARSLLLINVNLEGYIISTPQKRRKWKPSQPLVEDKGKPKGPESRWSVARPSRFFSQQCRKLKMAIPQLFPTYVPMVHNIWKCIAYFTVN
jgi:hypothetical protein